MQCVDVHGWRRCGFIGAGRWIQTRQDGKPNKRFLCAAMAKDIGRRRRICVDSGAVSPLFLVAKPPVRWNALDDLAVGALLQSN
jgi:hypothetical protein